MAQSSRSTREQVLPIDRELCGRMTYPEQLDSVPRLLTEFYTDGGDDIGPYMGGWFGCPTNFCRAGFVPAPGAAFQIGSQVTGTSVVNGAQYDHRMLIQWDTNRSNPGCTAAYWLLYDSTWVGHYEVGPRPTTGTSDNIPFDIIKSSFPEAHWYGEVFDNSEQTWTSADMTSGKFPASSGNSWKLAGYFRLMAVQHGVGDPWTSPSVLPLTGGDDANCYRGTVQFSTSASWLSTFWFGGPGNGGTNSNSSGTCDPY